MPKTIYLWEIRTKFFIVGMALCKNLKKFKNLHFGLSRYFFYPYDWILFKYFKQFKIFSIVRQAIHFLM
jgi:hypothetical protein